MKEDSLKQRISGYVEHKKTLWTAQIVLIGGLSTLILNLNNVPKIILFIIGVFAEYLVLSTIKDTDILLENLYKQLEK
jgi:hypothetical protein